MTKKWKRIAALSSAVVMATATLLYFPSDTLQNISWKITANAEYVGAVTWTKTESDGLTWTLYEDGTLTISGTGAMKDYYCDNSNLGPIYDNSDVRKVMIEDGITSIGAFAFFDCYFTSITIPDSVTSIGSDAFNGCCLTDITLPNGIISIGAYAFLYCPFTSITIPDSVTSIGESAFQNCSRLKTISLSCKSTLKRNDFGDQADLVSYTNQHALTKTAAKAATCTEDGNKEYWTCEHCGKYFLSDDTNPETAMAVELSETVLPAIQHKNATIRGAVEPTETEPGYSGDRCCLDCNTVLEKGYTYWMEDNLTWKLYEDGTLNISGTGAMKDYDVENNESPVSNNSNVKKIVIEDGVTSIGDCAFYYCKKLTSITIPGSVTSIGRAAFNCCWNLTSITIPNSVTSIGDSAFKWCIRLSSITLSNNTTRIGTSAFYDCSSLTSITIPNSVTCIENSTFYSCSGLTSITIPDSVTSIGYDAFMNCSSLTSITIPDSITIIGNSVFRECSSLTSITIPDSVTRIADYAFRDCSSLTSITIPDSVTIIGDSVFSDCVNLKTISLSCKSTLKKSNFGNQADLVSYTNQHALTKTAAKAATCTEEGNKEYWTCEHCGKYFLSDDTDPETAKAVELSGFIISASHKLTKVEAKAATCTEDGNKEYWTCEHCGKYFLSDDTDPETATAVEQSETILPAIQHKNVELRNVSEPTETAPGYSGDRYCLDCDTVLEKGYTYWIEDNLTWKLYEDGTLTISGTGAMKDYDYDDNQSPVYNNLNVKKVVIEKDVTSIGKSAFYKCTGLTSITIPDGVTSIGNHAFNDSGLTSITIPNGVTSIGEGTFFSCWSLTSITIPDSVTSIGNHAFSDCWSLTSITIPDSVTSIGEGAFFSCWSLTSITIPDSVTSIGHYAFKNCRRLKTISLSCKSTLKKSDFGEQADLVSYTPHTLTKTAAKAATCTEDGNKEYWTCEHCGKYFLSDDTDPETATAVELSETILPAIQHKNVELRNVSEPTETAPGYSGDRYCPDCNTVLEKGYTYWIEDNLTWKLYEDGTLNISGTGAMKDYNIDGNQSPVINHQNIKKVVIEDGVTSIGDWAFYHCSSLTSIVIPNSVTSIGDSVFYGCNGLTSIIIPDDVTSIGKEAFRFCSSLTSITIPNSVTSIGNVAFSECSSLTSITLPDSVTSIGDYAFYGCNRLTSITIPDGVTSIGESAFCYCRSLTSITIPDGVTSIGKSAFSCCSNLTSITIPGGVTSIGESAFNSCRGLTSIIILDGVTSIGKKAFRLCSSLTITIPDSVTSIGTDAFELSSLKTISLSCKSSLKKSDFGEQADLVSYNHKNAITRDATEPTKTAPGYSGDRYCPDCDTVLEKGYTYWIEDNLTWKLYEDGTLNISGTGAMKDYSHSEGNQSPVFDNDTIKSVVIEDGVTSIGNFAFKSCGGLISVTIPDSVTSIGNFAFSGCEGLTNITIPNSVTCIGMKVFGGCSGLTSITIPNSVTSIDEGAFEFCSSLTSILLPDGITSIGVGAFGNCESLINITIPDGVTSIGDWAFEECSNLTSITIPSSVTNIGIRAFDGCSNLTSITIPDGVTSIGDWAFYHCNSLTNITIPGSVTNIGHSTFFGCKNLTSITILDGVTSIGMSVFSNCERLTDIIIPNSVTSIEEDAFSNCKSLTSITIPNSVTSIENFVFFGCSSLTNITIPESVTSIGTWAFKDCSNLTNITIPSSVTSIGEAAFDNCNDLTDIYYLDTKMKWKQISISEDAISPDVTIHFVEPATTVYGDVNLDGKVDILDAVFLNKYLATMVQFSDVQAANADCCQDDVLNEKDANALLQFVILLIDDLPVPPVQE